MSAAERLRIESAANLRNWATYMRPFLHSALAQLPLDLDEAAALLEAHANSDADTVELSPKPRPLNTIARMLEAKANYVNAHPRHLSLVCLLPSLDHAEWLNWVNLVISDAKLGPRNVGLLTFAFGMHIQASDTATEIVVKEIT